jgi:predicted phage gp36 major capsid-like protein
MREPAPLTPEEEAFYLPELRNALRLLEAAATKLDEGDRYDRESARDLRGLARAVDQRARGIASGRASRSAERDQPKGGR